MRLRLVVQFERGQAWSCRWPSVRPEIEVSDLHWAKRKLEQAHRIPDEHEVARAMARIRHHLRFNGFAFFALP
jgi:hypothetical protein